MFVEGSKVLFRVGVALIASHEAAILACDDFGALFHFFNTLGQTQYDCDKLMRDAFAIKSIKRLAEKQEALGGGASSAAGAVGRACAHRSVFRVPVCFVSWIQRLD